mmetsp:Transcript_111486/g.314785  ORF Transcript_111486/g.314785 Transcript_111486/m.314785 type:complete len:275 (+) Transcript_111486:63-887(+)
MYAKKYSTSIKCAIVKASCNRKWVYFDSTSPLPRKVLYMSTTHDIATVRNAPIKTSHHSERKTATHSQIWSQMSPGSSLLPTSASRWHEPSSSHQRGSTACFETVRWTTEHPSLSEACPKRVLGQRSAELGTRSASLSSSSKPSAQPSLSKSLILLDTNNKFCGVKGHPSASSKTPSLSLSSSSDASSQPSISKSVVFSSDVQLLRDGLQKSSWSGTPSLSTSVKFEAVANFLPAVTACQKSITFTLIETSRTFSAARLQEIRPHEHRRFDDSA